MKNLGTHFTEYYRDGKFLGSITSDGILPDNQVGYVNRTILTDGIVALKKKHVASIESPLMQVRYNMQGRVETSQL
jgi:hypothetical protein